MAEKIIIAEEKDGGIYMTGSISRKEAEKNGTPHLTVVTIVFITDGDDKGSVIIHNRQEKQILKGINCRKYSYNFFGGHCNPPDENTEDIYGSPVSDEFMLKNMLRELGEEMYISTHEKDTEAVFLKNITSGEYIPARPFKVNGHDLIKLGITVYKSRYDNEYSYYYALPVSKEISDMIISADDFEKSGGTKTNIMLQTSFINLDRLELLYRENRNDTEICNAISRLFEKENSSVLKKLKNLINSYDHADT